MTTNEQLALTIDNQIKTLCAKDYTDSTFISERETRLVELLQKIKPLVKEWNNAVLEEKRAWKLTEEAKAARNQLRAIAENEQNQKLLYSYLHRLQIWPDPPEEPGLQKEPKPPMSELFYNKNLDPDFSRTKTWFETMGFKRLETTYAYSETWDKSEIKVTFLVPNGLGKDEKFRVIWFLHGGGFCTGAGDFIPWYSETSLEFAREAKAIVIAPDYPLGPEGNYEDIAISLKKFMQWYKEDGFVKTEEEKYGSWTSWLAEKANIGHVNIEQSGIVLDGESAGGHAALDLSFFNAENGNEHYIPIKGALLRFPMVKHYEREFREDTGYMGRMPKDFKLDRDHQRRALEEEILWLEKHGLITTRPRGYPAEWMSFAFLLSTSKRWEPMFKREHGPYNPNELPRNNNYGNAEWSKNFETNKGDIIWPKNSNESYTWDCLERAEKSVNKVSHEKLPPIVMYHGAKDPNCPFENTKALQELLIKHYSGAYNKDTAYLECVSEFVKTNSKGEKEKITTVGHGFDYHLKREDNPFLELVYSKAQSFWN